MRRRRNVQLELPEVARWGGKRAGAGRKLVASRRSPPHRPRARHEARWPVHVTWRAREAVPSLRSARVFPYLRRALSASHKPAFRVVHFSVQSDHVHLITEGDDPLGLVRGLQGLAVRCARAVNRAVHRRGSVWSSRYHSRALRTPTETRRGLVYVLLNFRKHLRAAPGVDPRSSGAMVRRGGGGPRGSRATRARSRRPGRGSRPAAGGAPAARSRWTSARGADAAELGRAAGSSSNGPRETAAAETGARACSSRSA